MGARAACVGVIRLSAVIGLRSGGGERTLCGPRAAENGPCVASTLGGRNPSRWWVGVYDGTTGDVADCRYGVRGGGTRAVAWR